MSFMWQERYQVGQSPLHRLDPRVKTVVTLLLILGVLLTPEGAWPAYPLLWALVGGLAAVGGLGAWRVARAGGVALPFALAAITLLFTVPGRPIAFFLGLPISDAGLTRFLSILFKSWLSVQAALLLAMSTPFTDLLWALGSLRLPGTLVAIVSFTYRYLTTLRDEAERLMRARAARSGSVAMLARGYAGEFRALRAPALTWGAVWRGAVPIAALAIIELLAYGLWK